MFVFVFVFVCVFKYVSPFVLMCVLVRLCCPSACLVYAILVGTESCLRTKLEQAVLQV